MRKNPKVVSFERSAAYLHHRAMLNRRENHIVDALELMRSAVEAAPENSEYRLDLAELLCEMGCHEQSSRLLLDMLCEKNPPSECYYGLALNQLGMNDVPSAKRLLRLYRMRDPRGQHCEDVSRLAWELDMFDGLEHPVSRKLARAMRRANRACEAMRAGDPEAACHRFEASLEMASEQCEMRALYAMSLLMAGREGEAREQADQASKAFPPSVRALCVCAQVYGLLGEHKKGVQLMKRAEAEHPTGVELRLMIYAAAELKMHDRAAEYARLALQETPFDRELLHIRGVALKRMGATDAEAGKCWARILRIDPEDSIALFYTQIVQEEQLDDYELSLDYQVPDREYKRRLVELFEALSQGYDHIRGRWEADPKFRSLLRWAVNTHDDRLGRASMAVLATLDSEEAVSLLRQLLFAADIPQDIKLHAAVLLKLQGRRFQEIVPESMDGMSEGLLDVEEILHNMPVGDRQLVRFTDEVLQSKYDISALTALAVMWMSYRGLRGMRGDPLKHIEAAAGALALNYLTAVGVRVNIGKLAREFGCTPRQLSFCAARIANRLEQTTILQRGNNHEAT